MTRQVLGSKRAPATRIRTRAERRAEARAFMEGRDVAKLNVREFARVREMLAIPTDASLTGAAARRTYLRQVREFLGPDAGSPSSSSPVSE
ncbi:MAG: hypothetical protein H0V43_07185 [Gemmatimonadales bacterium]|nr:hypothetical protein [Gemmatimonadales bacterium]